MKIFLAIFFGVGSLMLLVGDPAVAMGRQDEADDEEMKGNYPDYNKFEMKRTRVSSSTEAAGGGMTPEPAMLPPTLNLPVKPTAVDESTPTAPPKPVFMPDDASEPPMPDSIKDTLIQGTTAQ